MYKLSCSYYCFLCVYINLNSILLGFRIEGLGISRISQNVIYQKFLGAGMTLLGTESFSKHREIREMGVKKIFSAKYRAAMNYYCGVFSLWTLSDCYIVGISLNVPFIG